MHSCFGFNDCVGVFDCSLGSGNQIVTRGTLMGWCMLVWHCGFGAEDRAGSLASCPARSGAVQQAAWGCSWISGRIVLLGEYNGG